MIDDVATSKDRERYQINDADNGFDELEAVAYGDGITISIEEPWAGSTETGFGRHCSIRINRKQAGALGHWLIAQAAKHID